MSQTDPARQIDRNHQTDAAELAGSLVAAAVGEGSSAVRQVHEYLATHA